MITNIGKYKNSTTRTVLESFSLPQAFYYLAFALYCAAWCVDAIAIPQSALESTETALDAIRLLVITLLFLKLLIENYSSCSLLLIIALFIVVSPTLFATESKLLLWLIVFIAAADNISISKLATINLAVLASALAITLVFCGLGIIDNRVFENGTRVSLGFAHPNTLGAILLFLSIDLLVLRYPRYSFFSFALLLVFLALTWFIPRSRTSSLCIALVCLSALVVNIFKTAQKRRQITKVLFILFLLSAFASYFFMATYDPGNAIHARLNTLLSSRLYYAHYYFENYGLTAFGQSFANIPVLSVTQTSVGTFEQSLLLDNGYVNLLICYGVIPTSALLGIISFLFIKSIQCDAMPNYMLGLGLICIASVAEKYLFSVVSDYYIIAITLLAYSANRNRASLRPIVVWDKKTRLLRHLSANKLKTFDLQPKLQWENANRPDEQIGKNPRRDKQEQSRAKDFQRIL